MDGYLDDWVLQFADMKFQSILRFIWENLIKNSWKIWRRIQFQMLFKNSKQNEKIPFDFQSKNIEKLQLFNFHRSRFREILSIYSDILRSKLTRYIEIYSSYFFYFEFNLSTVSWFNLQMMFSIKNQNYINFLQMKNVGSIVIYRIERCWRSSWSIDIQLIFLLSKEDRNRWKIFFSYFSNGIFKIDVKSIKAAW